MVDPAQTVLGKAVGILRSFRADEGALSLAELVVRTGLPKSSVRRVADDLVGHGLLERATPGGYRLSGGLFELGLRASVERGLVELAMPFLQDLYESTHETVHLGVRDGEEVVYVVKLGGHRQARTPSRTGGRLPLHCTAIGKVLLAHADDDVRARVLAGDLERRTPHTVVAPGRLAAQLDAVVETGVAYEREESGLGLVCVAAPVLTANGRLVAGVSVAGPSSRFRPEAAANAVRAAAVGLGSILTRQGR